MNRQYQPQSRDVGGGCSSGSGRRRRTSTPRRSVSTFLRGCCVVFPLVAILLGYYYAFTLFLQYSGSTSSSTSSSSSVLTVASNVRTPAELSALLPPARSRIHNGPASLRRSTRTKIPEVAAKEGNEDEATTTTTIIILTLTLNATNSMDIPIQLYSQETPQATAYIRAVANAQTVEPGINNKCNLYRGEPIPDYWGSTLYPDRYFDGGRWGPPYALVQGQLVFPQTNPNEQNVRVPPAEPHHPRIERGMVAWAGGAGGPHFFIALRDHPEWGHEHTVFGRVIVEDPTTTTNTGIMAQLDALVDGHRPLVTTSPKHLPIVTNFVTPIPITVRLKK